MVALRDQATGGETYAYDKGYLRLTPFGARFLSVVTDFELPPGAATETEVDVSPADGDPLADGPEQATPLLTTTTSASRRMDCVFLGY